MSWIDETWLHRAMSALREMLDVDPHLRRRMIEFLQEEGFWDAERLTWDTAVARWNACLNPNKAEFFKVGELWALMRRFGRHQLFLAMAEDLGYEVRRMPTAARQQDLLERLAIAEERHAEELAAARAELARLQSGDAPALAGGLIPGRPPALSRRAVDVVGCP